MTALERRILAALTTNHTAALTLLNQRIVQRERPAATDTTDKTGR